MLKDRSYYTSLFTEYISGTASREQLEELLDFIASEPEEYKSIAESEEMLALVSSHNDDDSIIITDVAADRMRQRLLDGINAETILKKTGRVIPIWIRIAAAVAVVILLSIGYLIFRKDNKPVDIAQNMPSLKNDVPAPANNKARITLANGTTVSLDSLNAGTLAMQGNTKIVKNEKGEIVYEQSTENGQAAVVQYNTLYNPRGSQAIPLTLSDDSRVWLNAESSIKYPTSFSGNVRKVEITGEAYFEVAKVDLPNGQRMPFTVSKGSTEIAVLGTHFNVNAYDDEDALRVTLLEGSVKVSANNGKLSTTLRPGQQSVLTSNGQLITNNTPDLEAVMAWKNGLFHFSSATLPEVLRQLARWYDVDVTYEGTIPQMKFRGEIKRNTNLSQVLQILEESKVHFKIDGKKIVVLR